MRLVANITVQRYIPRKKLENSKLRMLEIGTKNKYLKYSFLFICTELRCTKRVGANKKNFTTKFLRRKEKSWTVFWGEKMKISFYFHDRFGVDQYNETLP